MNSISKEMSSPVKTRKNKAKPSIPISAASWGVLHIYLPQEDAFDTICQEIAEVYENYGFFAVDWEESEVALETYLGEVSARKPSLNSDAQLQEDEILVLGESAPGWVAVASSRYEFTPAGCNPLALALSKKQEIFAVTSIEGRYVEYTLYRDGKAQSMTVFGENLPENLPQLPVLNWEQVSHKGRDLSPAELSTLYYDPARLSELMGVDVLGYRASLQQQSESSSISDHDESLASLLIFRPHEDQQPDQLTDQLPNQQTSPEEQDDDAADDSHQPHKIYETAILAYQREDYQQALDSLAPLIQNKSDLLLHAFDLQKMILEKIQEKERRGQLIENPEEGSPIELYNAALSLLKGSEPSGDTLNQVLQLLEKSSQGGLIQANKLAAAIRKKISA